jgi:AraC-like DNA-binding protein
MIDGETDCYADARRYRLRGGEFFIAFPNQIHSYESFGREKYDLLIFSPDMLPEFAAMFESNLPKSAHVKAEGGDALNTFMDMLVTATGELKEGKKYSEEKLHGCLLLLFSELMRQLELYGPEPSELNALKTVVDYCSKNYTNELSLAHLSEELHMSKYYISHLFGSKLNMGFNDYVNSLRISRACVLLGNDDLSMTEISSTVGFATIRTFNRAFLRHTGQSPSDYRKRLKPDEAGASS